MKNIKKTIFTSALVLSTLAVTGVGVFATQKPSTASKIAETKTLKNGTDTVSNSKASPSKITSSKTTKRANSDNSANSQSNNSNSSASSSANESAKTTIPSSNSNATHSQKLATSSASNAVVASSANAVSASSASSVSSASSANAVVASSAKPVALAITEQSETSETNIQPIGSADTLYPTSPLYSAEASSASAAGAMESASYSSSSTTSSSSVSANVSSATSDYSSSSASSASAATSTLSFSNPITKVISYDFNGSTFYRTIELPADTKTVSVYEWSDKGTWSRFIEKNVPVSAFVSSYPTLLISSDADGFEVSADTSAGIHYEYVLKVAFD